MSSARTFGEMRTELKSLVNRSDYTDSLADTHIKDGINRCNRVFGTMLPPWEIEDTLAADANGYVEIPNDFLELKHIEEVGNENCVFKPATYAFIQRQRKVSSSAGTPLVRYYTRRNGKWDFHPALSSGATVNIIYSQDQAATGGDNDTNALLGFAPEAVKYAAAVYAADHFEDDRRLAKWTSAFNTIRNEIEEQLTDQEMDNAEVYSHYPDEVY